MSDDGAWHPFFRAPTELGAHSRMSDQFVATPANKRTSERGTIPNVNVHAFQCWGAIVDEEKIRSIKNAGVTCPGAVSDSRSENRVFDGERLQGDTANFDRGAILDHMAMINLVIR